LSNIGQHDKALEEIRRGRDLNPLSLGGIALEGQFLYFAGRHQEALERLREALDLEPNFWLTHLVLSRVYEHKGMHHEAAASARRAYALSGVNTESLALAAYSHGKAGEFDKALSILDELTDISADRYVPPYNFALVYAGLGDNEKSLNYLQTAFDERDARMTFLKIDPKWAPLRRSPRFMVLIQKMKLE
jgi:tetratricopeptide (TPR) repeat protein